MATQPAAIQFKWKGLENLDPAYDGFWNERQDKLNQMIIDNKLDLATGNENDLIDEATQEWNVVRRFVDRAAAQEYLDFLTALLSKYDMSKFLLSTDIIDVVTPPAA